MGLIWEYSRYIGNLPEHSTLLHIQVRRDTVKGILIFKISSGISSYAIGSITEILKKWTLMKQSIASNFQRVGGWGEGSTGFTGC